MGWRPDGEAYCTVDECGLSVLHDTEPTDNGSNEVEEGETTNGR